MTGMQEKLVNVIQGEQAISDNPNDVLTTVLGSCIAVCMSDPERGIGGMNHFLLPGSEKKGSGDNRFGAYAMELLINGLLRQGAQRHRLQAKMFGGASMIGSIRDIGGSNAAFAKGFLQDEGIPCLAESIGGTAARRVRYWPVTGRAQQMVVPGDVQKVAPIAPPPVQEKPKDDIVLF